MAKSLRCVDCFAPFVGHGLAKRCKPCFERNAVTVREVNRLIAGAIARGDMPSAKTLTCVDCGKQARDYDHRDYAFPFLVQPVCRKCNIRRGPAKPVESVMERV